MDDSMINPILLSSSAHLENVEQLIKNLEQQTVNVDNLLIKSITFPNDGNLSMDSLLTPTDLLTNDELKNQDGGFTWDDEYDTRANYRLTFTTNQSHRPKHRSSSQKLNISYTDDDPLSNLVNNNNNMNDWSMRSSFNNSLESSTTSSSTSWRQMKENQRLITDIPTKENPSSSSSSLNLYKIFQQKTHIVPRSALTDKSQSHLSTDQAIQTSTYIDSSSNSQYRTLFKPVSSSSTCKSLPDLSFISQYSKITPQSLNISRTTPSPTLIQQQKLDSDRPRTLKAIKRYKNSKHSTEPLGVFYSPQLRKTYAAIPTSTTTGIRMKCPSSYNTHQNLNIKYGSRTNSCDIQAMLQNQESPISENDTNSKRPLSETDISKLPDKILLSMNLYTYHSEYNLPLENSTKKSVNFSENISKHLISPCNPTITFNDNLCSILNKNNDRLTKKAYKEKRRCQTDIIVVDPVLHLQSFTDSPPNEFCLEQEKNEDDILMEKSHINIIPNLNSSEKNHQTSILDNILERISDIIKRLFDIKRSNKTFFLNNENNPQLDSLLKNDLCLVLQNILEHGRKDLKRITLWKIIETSINYNNSLAKQIPRVYYEAKQYAQKISSNWLYRFQAFIFVLLNKNELINWLYYFTRQKDIIQRYYQSPDALILVKISSTFNLFERIMTQLEKLTPLAFHLIYHVPDIPDEQINARDWIMTISRRSSKNLTQPVVQTNSNDTLRSTLSRKFNGFFTKTNPLQTTKSPGLVRRTRLSNVFTNTSRGVSPSTTFQSKIPRPSLNVDKPKVPSK